MLEVLVVSFHKASRGPPRASILAAAALLLLRTAPASDLAQALATDVPTRSSQIACVHVFMLHHFHWSRFVHCLAHGVNPPHGEAARAQRAARLAVVRPRGAPPCLRQRSAVHGQHRTFLCQVACTSCSAALTASCCTIGMCVTAVDACCSDRAATTGEWPAGLCASGAGASRAASALPTGPTFRGGPAGRCLRASSSSSSRGARDASNPAAHGARARADCVLCACARAGTRPRLRRRPRRRRLSSARRVCPPPPQPRRRSPQRPPRFGPAPLVQGCGSVIVGV